MSVSNFISNFKSGFRPTRFRVQLTYPAASGIPNVLDEFVVTTASLPESSVGTATVSYQGRDIKMIGERGEFADWQVTVLCDTDFSHRDALLTWLNNMSSHEGNIAEIDPTNPNTYMANLYVTALGLDDTELKTVTIQYAFPTNVGEISLDYSNKNAIATFPVTFANNGWVDPAYTT